MQKRYLDDLLSDHTFAFKHLTISDIDNKPVADVFSKSVLEQEVCLFARDIPEGDAYCEFTHERLKRALEEKLPLPIARFADGEFAFYSYTLGCNGLYKQAESVETIRKVIPQHIAALQYLSEYGLIAPLVYPGNSHVHPSGLFSFLKKRKDSSGADFLSFLNQHKIFLTARNYIPFYVVYAYLSSRKFAQAVHNKNVCILNSDFNPESCVRWFSRQGSAPSLSFVEIPREYVATRWESIRDGLLKQIPVQTELCIVGAGVGALLLCKDIAEKFSIPVVDAGHVLNMMNDRVDKSNGVRLYTLRKIA